MVGVVGAEIARRDGFQVYGRVAPLRPTGLHDQSTRAFGRRFARLVVRNANANGKDRCKTVFRFGETTGPKCLGLNGG